MPFVDTNGSPTKIAILKRRRICLYIPCNACNNGGAIPNFLHISKVIEIGTTSKAFARSIAIPKTWITVEQCSLEMQGDFGQNIHSRMFGSGSMLISVDPRFLPRVRVFHSDGSPQAAHDGSNRDRSKAQGNSTLSLGNKCGSCPRQGFKPHTPELSTKSNSNNSISKIWFGNCFNSPGFHSSKPPAPDESILVKALLKSVRVTVGKPCGTFGIRSPYLIINYSAFDSGWFSSSFAKMGNQTLLRNPFASCWFKHSSSSLSCSDSSWMLGVPSPFGILSNPRPEPDFLSMLFIGPVNRFSPPPRPTCD